MSWLKQFFNKLFGKSERKFFDKSDLEYKDSDNTQIKRIRQQDLRYGRAVCCPAVVESKPC